MAALILLGGFIFLIAIKMPIALSLAISSVCTALYLGMPVASILQARIPMGRIGQKRDLIGPLLLFASSASDFITGQILYVDGGITSSQ